MSPHRRYRLQIRRSDSTGNVDASDARCWVAQLPSRRIPSDHQRTSHARRWRPGDGRKDQFAVKSVNATRVHRTRDISRHSRADWAGGGANMRIATSALSSPPPRERYLADAKITPLEFAPSRLQRACRLDKCLDRPEKPVPD